MTLCANERCTRGEDGERAAARERSRYCSTTCGIAVRIQRLRARAKAGISLKRCPACKGTGYVQKGKP